MTASRQDLLLAYGIVEYQTAIDHLHALRSASVSVPYSAIGRLEQEQSLLAQRWLFGRGDPRAAHDRMPDVLTEVRDWLREHLHELEQLLDNERNTG